ncbi:hypothetical protein METBISCDRAFT_14312 [Metschnikowia bicuspidata]|uniref:Mitochondrial chaperone BCS1 n=1 Tax=Metschnikowia bicuspidata TaxID=27322 RepID=A0A4P9ZEC4_9ASCO|nr:hypothetical protein METBISCDRAFT_14312 [Metschnikowia bicuspidata]
MAAPVPIDLEKIRSADGSVSALARLTFNEAIANNPYFAAGGGLMLLGTGLALARLAVVKGLGFLYRQMLVDLEIPSKDKLYLWFLEWMAQHKHRRLRHLSVETSYTQHDNGAVSTRFLLVPGPGKHLIRYRGAWMLVARERSGKLLDMTNGAPFETVTLTTLYSDRHLFPLLLAEAKTMALRAQEGKTLLYSSWGPDWRQFGSPRVKRQLGSVILADGISESVLADVRDFLSNCSWYHERGIPYRRGYLLYGPPGSGKTSFIQALAGELDYNICILNLAEKNLTDDRLNHLMNHLPLRSILLLEDIDAAFNKRTQTNEQGFQSGVTFSGLLNALDGVASAEECITFMTSNHPDRLDPALLRPGRVDYKVMVGNATESQVRRSFLRFYEDKVLCEKFVRRFMELGYEGKISTAQLQGLFVFNKSDAASALEMLPTLVQPNKGF